MPLKKLEKKSDMRGSKHRRVEEKRNSRRMNRLEELGRVDAEKAKTTMGKKNLRQEKARILRDLKADGGKVKKKSQPGQPTPKTREPERQRRMGNRSRPKGIKVMVRTKEGPANKYNTDKVFTLKKDGGKVGGLKKPTPNQKGLKKLPREVRNKMGYMKKGGRVGMGKALRGGGCVR